MNIELNRNISMACLVTLIVSACSMLYELLIAQTLNSVASNTVLWYSLTIGLYLASMGYGAFLCSKLYKDRFTWLDLFRVELLLALAGGLAVPLLYFTHALYIFLTMRGLVALALTSLFLIFFAVVIAVGVLTGLELPLLIGLGNALSPPRTFANRILCADYAGSLAGALLFSLVLLPKLELLSIGYLTALVNVSAALFILCYFVKKATSADAALLAFLCAALLLGLAGVTPASQYFLKKEYFYKYTKGGLWPFFGPLKDFPDIERYRSLYQMIDIVKVPDAHNREAIFKSLTSAKYAADPDFPRGYLLFLDKAFQFSSDGEEFYHEYLAHVPVNLNGTVPRKILVLGAGDGLLVRELIKYPQIEHITLIDIDQKMIELAQNHPVLTSLNKHSFNDPRVEIKIADAFYYLKNNREEYDAVYIDLPVAESYTLSKLYSREFFVFVRRALSDRGYAAFAGASFLAPTEEINGQPAGLSPAPDIYWDIYFNTLKAAGFDTVIPYFSNFTGQREELRQAALDYLEQNAPEWQRLAAAGKVSEAEYKEVQRQVAWRIADEYLAANMDRFIMMKKGPEPVTYTYTGFGVPLYVLNERLFNDAFTFNSLYAGTVDPRLVNSIMRPTLPRSLFLNSYEK